MKPTLQHARTRRSLLGVLALAPLAAAHAADEARALRDPMAPPFGAPASAPVGAPAAPVAPAGAPRPEPAARLPQHIVVVDGRHYVIDAGQRRGVGDTFGAARIERIDDTGVWVRDGAALRRLPMYGQAVKRAAGAETTPGAPGTPPAAALATDDAAARRRHRVLSHTSLPGDPS